MLSRTFTLLEAAELSGGLDPGDLLPGAHLADRARTLVEAMAANRSRRRASETDDVADPIGRPVEDHQAAGDAIQMALLPLLDRFLALANEPAPTSRVA